MARDAGCATGGLRLLFGLRGVTGDRAANAGLPPGMSRPTSVTRHICYPDIKVTRPTNFFF